MGAAGVLAIAGLSNLTDGLGVLRGFGPAPDGAEARSGEAAVRSGSALLLLAGAALVAVGERAAAGLVVLPAAVLWLGLLVTPDTTGYVWLVYLPAALAGASGVLLAAARVWPRAFAAWRRRRIP